MTTGSCRYFNVHGTCKYSSGTTPPAPYLACHHIDGIYCSDHAKLDRYHGITPPTETP